MAVPLTLKVFKGDTLIAARDFERDIIKIGRLSSAHLRLEDEKVSRVHSVLEVAADGSLSIIDMGSVEGTWVNGKRVTKGRVSFGDEIRLGGTTLRLERPGSATQQHEVLAPVVEAPREVLAPVVEAPREEPAPQEPAPPVRVVRRSKARGPRGVSLSFQWGDQRVGEFFLLPGEKKSFSVGSAAGVDFVMGDARLGSPRLEVLRTDGQTFSVCFTGKMKGELLRGGESLELQAVIESGKATLEDSAYALALEEEDLFWVDLGGVRMEVGFRPMPKRVHIPLADAVDYRAVNIFLLILFTGSMFVIGATNRLGGDEAFTDELSGDTTRLTKLIIKPPDTKAQQFVARLNERKEARRQLTQPATSGLKKPIRKPEGKPVRSGASNPPDKHARARSLANQVFGPGKGLASVFSNTGLGSDFKSAIVKVSSASVLGPGGIDGLVTKGTPGTPGGTGGTIGLDGIRTRGRDTGYASNVDRPGGLGGKASVDPFIVPSEIDIKEGSLDKELVRKVIQDNKSQIRACFERLLNQYPELGGKVQTQFTIGAEGQVLTARVAGSTTGSKELDGCVASRVRLWQFPKPKGGGQVVVSYPFLFKQAGR
ncbi:MAG: TonB family protein [Myxococcaceae bacterium]|nr:TonB family protein [Myxococcaceae bacterium]